LDYKVDLEEARLEEGHSPQKEKDILEKNSENLKNSFWASKIKDKENLLKNVMSL